MKLKIDSTIWILHVADLQNFTNKFSQVFPINFLHPFCVPTCATLILFSNRRSIPNEFSNNYDLFYLYFSDIKKFNETFRNYRPELTTYKTD